MKYLLNVDHSETNIMKRINVSRMTVYRVATSMKNSKSLRDHTLSGRPQVIRRGIIRKAFENDPHLKMTTLARQKKISVSAVSRVVKSMEGKSLRRSKRPS